MPEYLSRRDFLMLGALSLGGLAARPLRLPPPWKDQPYPFALGRVTVDGIYLYNRPSFQSERAGIKKRDELLYLLGEVISDEGPGYNPRWYRVIGGYAHSGRVQKIDLCPGNKPVKSITDTGILGEVTVPYLRAYRNLRSGNWERLYRLYYSSVHWITGLDPGPDGSPWYRLKDHLIEVEYHAPAAGIRLIDPEEYAPLADQAAPEEKRIDISIDEQILTAYERDRIVLQTKVATGVPSRGKIKEGELPTDTPLGRFRIQNKMPSRHMGDGKLTDDIAAYELTGVPWTMIFHKDGIALHGTYWHDNFGVRMSHGCVNLRNADAQWLFRWTDPVYDHGNYFVREAGTVITIH